MTSDRQRPPSAGPGGQRPGITRRLTSEQLFAGADLVVIEHQGADYQLRITRQGKLILTK